MSIAAPLYKPSWYHGVIREKDESSEYTTHPPGSIQTKEKLKLDSIMQRLFKLSALSALHLINGLFDECFSIDDVSIRYGNSVFIKDAYDRIIGDDFITLETGDKTFNYHKEFQTLNDDSMLVRMFRYGFEKAVEHAKSAKASLPLPADGGFERTIKSSHLGKTKKQTVLSFPKQVVIFLEKNESIRDEMSFTIRLPDGTAWDYTVPVVKYWTYSTDDLVDRRMYSLLPLQVFQFRKIMKAISNSNRSDEVKSRLITEQFKRMEQTIRPIIEVLGELEGNVLTIQELDGILSALQNLTNYIYGHYGEYNTFEKEVRHMIDTIIDPKLWERAKKEGIEQGIEQGEMKRNQEVAKNLFSLGADFNMIIQATGLTKEEIIHLQGKS